MGERISDREADIFGSFDITDLTLVIESHSLCHGYSISCRGIKTINRITVSLSETGKIILQIKRKI